MKRFQLTKNAQFFVVKDSDGENRAVPDCLEKIKDSLRTEAVVCEFLREKIALNGAHGMTGLALASGIVFISERPVYFWNDGLTDIIHGFILFIEIDSHVALLRSNCGSIDDIEETLGERLNFESIAAAVVTENAEFQQLTVRNMTISEKAMRSRSYEAADLKGLVASNSTGRSIPTHVLLREPGGRPRSITPSTGRLAEKSSRLSIEHIALWTWECIQGIKASVPGSGGFLQSFARQVQLSDILSRHKPTGVLIDVVRLRELLEPSPSCLFIKKNGKRKDIGDRLCERILTSLEPVWNINQNLLFERRPSGHQLRLKINSSSISVEGTILRRIHVAIDNKETTLARLINSQGLLTVSFDTHQYMYHAHHCFEDVAAKAGIQSILDMMVPIPSIAKASSEKGETSTRSISFDVNSLFGIVEDHHRNDDLVICDDLGNEWADHICINMSKGEISFIHSKHGDETSSASKFHDVVGQAIKNLGNLYFTPKQLTAKWNEKFSRRYPTNSSHCPAGSSTKIRRIRRGDKKWAKKNINQILGNPRLLRRMILCCSFVSESRIKTELNKLTGEKPPGHIVQLYWILSSFAQAAKDANVQPIIYCKS